MASAAPPLRLAADLVLASHEAWDGGGYPRHLARTAIPLGARIVAVADTYDVLTWSRAVGEPVLRVRAAAELVRAAGTQFDPDLVHAWLRLLDRAYLRSDGLPTVLMASGDLGPVAFME